MITYNSIPYNCSKGGTIIETSNALYAFGNGNGGEGGATFESTISNARYAVTDGRRGEGGAITESLISNTRYAIGDSDGGEGGAN